MAGESPQPKKKSIIKIKRSKKIDEKVVDKNLPTTDVSHNRDVALYSPGLSGGDPLSIYMRQISRYDLLSPEQEAELTKSFQESGDIEVAKKLVLANLRLVVKIALEYKTAWQNVMDLIQEGNVGLMKAVSKYDSSKGAKLSYYASWWIRSYILKFLLDNFRMVKIGTTNEQKKLFYNLMREKERLLAQGLGSDPKLIGEALGVSEKSVIEMGKRMAPSSGDISLDAPIDDEGQGKLSDLMEQMGAGPEEEVASQQELEIMNKNLKSFLENLKPRDREVFGKRLLQEVPESLQTIADQYGVTRERIRQIEERLLQQLRVYMSQYLR